jgi:DNA (cytosine-5)-methyltransferase 1
VLETVGSICSGIEAASVAWKPFGLHFKWFSEIASFPSRVLKEKYPDIPNLGDMNNIDTAILKGKIFSPDIICGGTPCQAFSLAGWKNGLNDDRGNLTLRFVDIIEANDAVRQADNKKPTIVFWENVEGVLTDKTNAFGCLVSSLAGLDTAIGLTKWPNAGLIRGPKRNVAWRVLDAKFFGLPQQRRRLYLLAGGRDFFPENVLFENHDSSFTEYPSTPLVFEKERHTFEIFREYTDCLYSAYGTKWNGNAAANNGSLFVVQDGRLRRLSPLECERLMGFPDNYTNLPNARKTNRYQAIGNSWAVPVVRWIGKRLMESQCSKSIIPARNCLPSSRITQLENDYEFYDFNKDVVTMSTGKKLNCTSIPEHTSFKSMKDIISPEADESIYISPVGCYGIIRRKQERHLTINARLEKVLLSISAKMSPEEIEKRSRIQHRGRLSDALPRNEKVAKIDNLNKPSKQDNQLSFFT